MRVIALGAVAAAACAGSPRPVATAAAPVASAEQLAALEGETVISVDLSGQRAVAAGPLLALLASRPGELYDPEKVAADVRRLWGAAAFADVAALARRAPGGVALTFAVVERPLVRAARFEGDAPPPGTRRIAGLAGGLYEPARLQRMADRLESSYRRAGHRRARVELRVRPAGAGRVDVVVRAAAGPRYLLGAIAFAGATRFDGGRLVGELRTHDGAVNVAGAPYREDLLVEDLARMQYLYWDLGMMDVRIGPPEVKVDERARRLRVLVPVREGAVYRLGRIRLAGRLARQRRRYLAALGIRPGEIFARARLASGMDRVQTLARRLTGSPVALLPETAVDPDRHTIDLTLSIDGEEPR